jgi:hypothetical protein
MSETWYKEYCPKCDTHNWVCDGDTTDITGMDIEAIKCRKCHHIFTIADNGETWEELYGEGATIEDSNWEEGIEDPNI